ncbi:MAG TPA: glycosyltransferase [Luteimicrobium sp.]|nr:glycosyltransferase [Luteimicrobium sp.]
MTAPPAPLHVVVVDHTASLGGGELALARLLGALSPAEVQARVVLFEDGPLVRLLREAGARVDVVPLDGGVRTAARDRLGSRAVLRSALSVVPFTVRLARTIRAMRPDVVHTSSLKADVLGSVAARLARVPVVWHVHDRIADDYLPHRVAQAFRWAARRVPRRVVANSRATAATLDGARSVVAYPGFTPDQVRRDAKVRTGPDVRTVGLVGRLSPTKGQLELVRAARLVLDVRPDVRFRIVGAPMFGAEDYAAEVEAEIERLGLREAVVVEGFTADVKSILDALTVLVHASPVPEPFGQVVVEAMIRGVPVIATDAGGVPEILRDGGRELGVLVEPGDVHQLADALVAVLDGPDEAAGRAADAYDSALRRFPVSETARVVTAVWGDVVRGPRRERRA